MVLTDEKLIAVAWAAIFVPFRVFLKPSTPHDLYTFTSPKTKDLSKSRRLLDGNKYLKIIL